MFEHILGNSKLWIQNNSICGLKQKEDMLIIVKYILKLLWKLLYQLSKDKKFKWNKNLKFNNTCVELLNNLLITFVAFVLNHSITYGVTYGNKKHIK